MREGSGPRSHPSTTLVDAFTEMAGRLHSSEDFDDTFRRIGSTARDVLTGCESASITILERAGPVSRGITDSLAERGDIIQYEEDEGPCLDAAMRQRAVYTPDMLHARHWPTSSRRLADELGVRSMLSCRLALDAFPHQTLGGINMYARQIDAFSDEDQLLAILLASLGAVVIDAARQQANLRAAIESRQVIGEAIGILRAQGDVSSDQAFRMLSQASQRMNVKLRDLARQIADGAAAPRQAKS